MKFKSIVFGTLLASSTTATAAQAEFQLSGSLDHWRGLPPVFEGAPAEFVLWSEGQAIRYEFPGIDCGGLAFAYVQTDTGAAGALLELGRERLRAYFWKEYGPPECLAGGEFVVGPTGDGPEQLKISITGFENPREWLEGRLSVSGTVTHQSAQEPFGLVMMTETTRVVDSITGLSLGASDNLGRISIAAVRPGSPAALMGLNPSDMINGIATGAAEASSLAMLAGMALLTKGSYTIEVIRENGDTVLVPLFSFQDDPIVAAQLAAAARTDEFGPLTDREALRIRLMADGSFEALGRLSEHDNRDSLEFHTDLSMLVSPPRSGEEQATYEAMIASYATARLQLLGDCGEPTTPMRLDVVNVWETRRNGVVVDVDDLSYSLDFNVISRFARIVQNEGLPEQPGAPGWTSVLRAYSDVFENLSCDSPQRVHLEDNMIAYAEGREPVFRRSNW